MTTTGPMATTGCKIERISCDSNIIECLYLDTDDPRQSGNEGIGACGYALVGLSYVLVVLTFPFSLCICIKVCLNEMIISKDISFSK